MKCVSPILLWTVLLPALVGAVTGVQAGDVLSDPLGQAGPCPIVLTQIPSIAPGLAADESNAVFEGELPIGARIVLHACGEGHESAKILTPDFAAAGWPDVSFDGKRILLIGKRAAADPFSVWELGLEAGEFREIIRPPGNCRQAIYLSTLFTLEADRPFEQIAFLARGEDDEVDALYTCRLDGSRVRRVTFSPFGVSDPYALSDGRLLFAMPDGDAAGQLKVNLFTVHTDGSDLFPFTGIYGPPRIAHGPCETIGGAIVFVEPTGCAPYGGGLLAAVSRTRSLRSYKSITDGRSGCFHLPSPLPDGRLLVSHCRQRDTTYGIVAFDPRTGVLDTVFDDPLRHDLAAQLVRPHRPPDGRSTSISDRTTSAQLYCLNTYLSDTLEGRLIQPGAIRRVRILTADVQRSSSPSRNPVDGHDRSSVVRGAITPQVIGVVDVESDGSFFVEVPAGVPLRFETLDEKGRILQAMRTWTWVMPGEERGCIGCHEDRESSPPNRHVLALRKPPQSVRPPRTNLGEAGSGDSPRMEPLP